MTAHIDLNEGLGLIILTCSDREHDLAKRIPGGRYKKPVWTYPLSFGTCLAARAEFGASLTVGPALNEWAGAYLDWRAAMLQRPFNLSPNLEGPFKTERQHQVWGGDLLSYVGRGLLLDPMRLGKTITVLRALRNRGLTQFLVVAPNTTLLNWKKEIEMWHPKAASAGVTVVKGTPLQKAKLIAAAEGPVVINWEGIRSLSRLAPYGSIELTEKQKTAGPLNLHHFDAIVADEIHRAVDPHAQQTRAFWSLAHAAGIRYGLSGTILPNSPEDLWAVMYGLVPYEYPVKSHFVDRYTLSGQGSFGFEVWGWNPHTKAELFTILDPRTVRRTWGEAGVVMPEKLPPQVRGVEMEGPQGKTYAQLKKQLALSEGDQLLVVQNPLELQIRLIQAACATPVLGSALRKFTDKETGEEIEREVTTIESLKMPSCKINALFDIIEEAAGESIVVFAESKLLINLAEEQLKKGKITVGRITGDEPPGVRQDNMEAFQAGNIQVILCTYGAGSEGITLSRGTILVRLQRSRSMVQSAQAEARTEAMGKAEPTQVIDVFTTDSIESRVWDAGDVKAGHLAELLRDELR